jgi:hypothetical protein
LFFAKGLDDPNQLDAARQIAVFAHVIFRPRGRAIVIARSDSARRANRSAKILGQQFDAMMFWDRFQDRWLRGEEFTYSERPENMPRMKEIDRARPWNAKPPDLRR